MSANIAICGGIAVGKTTLGTKLCSMNEGWTFLEERPGEVAFIQEFYSDKERWAFHSRMGMLEYFFRRGAYLEASKGITVQDRTLHELIIFAEVQKELGTMSAKEFDLYDRIFTMLSERHPLPDVVVRCKCSAKVALQRVLKRGREFELGIKEDYISAIELRYDLWQERQSKSAKFIVINTDRELDVSEVSRKINDALR